MAKTKKEGMGDFIRERPGMTLALLLGVGALAGAEWAVGALVGGLAMALVTKKSGAELREKLLARGREWVHLAEEKLHPPQST